MAVMLLHRLIMMVATSRAAATTVPSFIQTSTYDAAVMISDDWIDLTSPFRDPTHSSCTPSNFTTPLFSGPYPTSR